eukprot:510186-Ditylum_brightwellii.AAC.1
MIIYNNNNNNIYDEDTVVLDTPSVSDNNNNNDSSVWSLETVTKDDGILKVNIRYKMCYHQKWLENLLVTLLENSVDWF